MNAIFVLGFILDNPQINIQMLISLLLSRMGKGANLIQFLCDLVPQVLEHFCLLCTMDSTICAEEAEAF